MPVNRLPPRTPFPASAERAHTSAPERAINPAAAPAPTPPAVRGPATPSSARALEARINAFRRQSTPPRDEPATTALESKRLNTAQVRHVPHVRYTQIDLTGDDAPRIGTLTLRRPEEAFVETGKQVYAAALDRIFPIRDPADPSRVHPDFADPDDPARCAPQVSVRRAHFYADRPGKVSEDKLWHYATHNFGGTPFSSQTELMAALRQSCVAELRATLRGAAPPSCGSVRVATITSADQCDDEQEAAALIGQYGCFLTDYGVDAQPSLRNGRIVAVFAGARLASDDDDEQYLKLLGPEFGQRAMTDYGVNVRPPGKKEDVTWAPYGGGNMVQYVNSTFSPNESGVLVCDPARTNAMFAAVRFDLTDREGKRRQESMIVLVQHRPVAQGKQLKADYGGDYTLELAPRRPVFKVDPDAPEAGKEVPARPEPPAIKSEPVDDDDMHLDDVPLVDAMQVDMGSASSASPKRRPAEQPGELPNPKRARTAAGPSAAAAPAPDAASSSGEAGNEPALPSVNLVLAKDREFVAGLPPDLWAHAVEQARKSQLPPGVTRGAPPNRNPLYLSRAGQKPLGNFSILPGKRSEFTARALAIAARLNGGVPEEILATAADAKLIEQFSADVFARAQQLAAEDRLPTGVRLAARPGRGIAYQTCAIEGHPLKSFTVIPGARDEQAAKTLAIATRLASQQDLAREAEADDAAIIRNFPPGVWERALRLAGEDTLPPGVKRRERDGSNIAYQIPAARGTRTFAVRPGVRDEKTARAMAIATRLIVEDKARRKVQEADAAIIRNLPADIWDEAQQVAQRNQLPGGVCRNLASANNWRYMAISRDYHLLGSFSVTPGRDDLTAKTLAIAKWLEAERRQQAQPQADQAS